MSDEGQLPEVNAVNAWMESHRSSLGAMTLTDAYYAGWHARPPEPAPALPQVGGIEVLAALGRGMTARHVLWDVGVYIYRAVNDRIYLHQKGGADVLWGSKPCDAYLLLHCDWIVFPPPGGKPDP